MMFGRKRRNPRDKSTRSRRLGIEMLEDRRMLAAGALDPTFGTDGIVMSDFPIPGSSRPTYDEVRDLALQPNGKIVAAGTSVTRYNADGTLDPTFGDGGNVSKTTVDGIYAHAVAIDQADRIIVAGEIRGSDGAFSIIRLNTNGELDESFGENGKVSMPTGQFAVAPQSLALDDEGRIVVAGGLQKVYPCDGTRCAIAIDTRHIALERFNPDGTLDQSFGDGGRVKTTIGLYSASASDVAIDSSGKIVVAGNANGASGTDFAVLRFEDDGTLDPSFGENGKVLTDFQGTSEYGYALALDGQGAILVAGETYRSATGVDFALVRYDAAGQPDVSFGDDGLVVTDFGTPRDNATDIEVQPDGKIVVAGRSLQPTTGFDFALARYNTDGSLDDRLGNGGLVTTDFNGDTDGAEAVAIQPDGRILLGGYAKTSERFFDQGIARYEGVDTPREQINWLIEEVQRLADDGVLNNGQGNSLLAKLEGSIHQLDRDNFTPAINKLEAFTNEINALVKGGVLTEEEGLPLIEVVDNIIEQLLGELLIG